MHDADKGSSEAPMKEGRQGNTGCDNALDAANEEMNLLHVLASDPKMMPTTSFSEASTRVLMVFIYRVRSRYSC